jgi:hypothetical protein
VIALAATAISHHLELLAAAIVVNTTPVRRLPNTANFPELDNATVSAISGANLAVQ